MSRPTSQSGKRTKPTKKAIKTPEAKLKDLRQTISLAKKATTAAKLAKAVLTEKTASLSDDSEAHENRLTELRQSIRRDLRELKILEGFGVPAGIPARATSIGSQFLVIDGKQHHFTGSETQIKLAVEILSGNLHKQIDEGDGDVIAGIFHSIPVEALKRIA